MFRLREFGGGGEQICGIYVVFQTTKKITYKIFVPNTSRHEQ